MPFNDLDAELARINARLGQSKRLVPVPIVPMEASDNIRKPECEDPLDEELARINARLGKLKRPVPVPIVPLEAAALQQHLPHGDALPSKSRTLPAYEGKSRPLWHEPTNQMQPSASYEEFALGRGRKVSDCLFVVTTMA